MHILTDSNSLRLLLKASTQAAVLTVLILIAQRLLGRRLEPRWRSALWLLVLLRLALPWTISSPVSVFNLGRAFHQPSRIGAAVHSSFELTPSSREAAPPSPTVASGAIVARGPANGLLLPELWFAGVLLCGFVMGFSHWRFHRQVVRSQTLVDEPTLRLLEECKTTMRVQTPVAIVETPVIDGPCLFGFVRPRLLLPPGFVFKFSREELRFVFLHELAHIKRRDILLGWLAAALQIVHWFNPFVWLAFFRMRADRELACDALALAHAGSNDAQPYGRTIIKLLENFGDALRAPGLAGILEDKQQMKQRLVMIAQFDKSRRYFGVAASIFCVLALVALTDAQTPSEPRGGAASATNNSKSKCSTTATSGPRMLCGMPIIMAKTASRPIPSKPINGSVNSSKTRGW